MASRNPYAGNPGAAQSFIHALGFTDRHPSGKQAERIAWNLERQLERGQPLDYPAARGHAVTPEHPGRKLPGKMQYASGRKSKYVAMPEASRRRGGGGGGGGVRVQRPLVHDFRGVTPDRRAVKLAGGRLSRTVTQPRQALAMIQRAALDGARVRIDAFDCSGNFWISFFANVGEWHGRQHLEGITASELLNRRRESGLNLEEYLLSLAHSGRYGKKGERMSHICLFSIFVTPVHGAAVASATGGAAPSPYRRR